jgi:hypothetical protein
MHTQMVNKEQVEAEELLVATTELVALVLLFMVMVVQEL